MEYDFSGIKAHYDEYLSKVEKHAQKFGEDVLYPWLDKRGLSFMAGMGTYVIFNSKTTIHIEHIKKFVWLHDILSESIPGTNNGFGEFIRDHKNT